MNGVDAGDDAVFRALANPIRRQLLDALRDGPRTTGQLASELPTVSRYAVMQHLRVLVEAGLVLVRRGGRERYNYLHAVPIRRTYERWVGELSGSAAAESLALYRAVTGALEREMALTAEPEVLRVVRIENELRFRAPCSTVFDVMTQRVREWFPATHGGERTVAVILEPRVDGAVFEDWGSGAGYLYGHVTAWDPPHRVSMRTRLHPGTTMDTTYDIAPEHDGSVLRMQRVVVGPITDEQAAGIRMYGDLAKFEDALRGVIEAA